MTTVPAVPARPPAAGLAVLAGGVAALVSTLMPWTSVLTVDVTGAHTSQGKAATAAAAVAITAGYQLARSTRLRRGVAAIAFAAGIAIAVTAGTVAATHDRIVERRLDGQLAAHGLRSTDLLGSDDEPSLLDTWRPLLRGPAADVATAIDSASTPRTGIGLWIAIAVGIGIAVAALVPLRSTTTRGRDGRDDNKETPMTTTSTYTVTGMTCGGCVRRVRKAISDVEGVTDVDVQFKGGVVTVTSGAPIDDDAVRAAVGDVGYDITRA